MKCSQSRFFQLGKPEVPVTVNYAFSVKNDCRRYRRRKIRQRSNMFVRFEKQYRSTRGLLSFNLASVAKNPCCMSERDGLRKRLPLTPKIRKTTQEYVPAPEIRGYRKTRLAASHYQFANLDRNKVPAFHPSASSSEYLSHSECLACPCLHCDSKVAFQVPT